MFYHHDVLGSPATATNELGQVIWHERTESYGKSEGRVSQNGNAFGDNALPASNSRQGYTGHTLDNSAGLTYMKARYYDHNIGRFLSNDPVGYTLKNPTQSFNRYLYANNNPYKYTDPSGEFFFLAAVPYAVTALGYTATAMAGLLLGGVISEQGIAPAMNNDSSNEDDDPEISEQKQRVHIAGTPQNKNENKQREQRGASRPSTWDNPEEADDVTQEAWRNGTPVPGRPDQKTYETGRRVGTDSNGDGQSGVKVMQDKKGKIHATPWGTDLSDTQAK